MNNTFNYNHRRAREARIAKTLKSPLLKALITISIFGLGLSGIALLFIHNMFGWIAVGLSGPFIMLHYYTKYQLESIKIGKTDDINDILSGDLLALFGKNITATSMAKIIHLTRSGHFLALRFHITPNFFDVIIPGITASPEEIFERARIIQKKTKSEQIAGGVLSIALVESYPGYESLLNQMKLTIDDLYQGVIWYNHLHGVVKDAKKPRHTGGIARDFMFGYIPILQHFGVNISEERERTSRTQIHQASHKEIIDKMIEIFSKGGRQNVALIGAYGSGRSTVVNAFAELLLDADSDVPANLKFRQIFNLDVATLLSAAGERGQIENLMMRLIGEAHAAKNIILCFDNAHLFFEEGTGSVDISNVLLPYIEGRAVRMILMMDQQKFLEISARNSALTNALNKIMVTPADEAETMKVLQDQVPILEWKHNVVFTYRSLVEAYRLSERYIHDAEMPGKAKILLESAASYPEEKMFITDISVQRAIEKTEGVKLQVANSEEDRNRLLNLEDLIHERMIDQVEAVKTVSDALRRAAAGVRNEKRPIGTFLFLGPTGVGKTELAKALSEVYFNGESQIVRLDLNEFVSANDVSRLIADGAEDSLSLTAQVMKHPFSVVLLDEIEKAHPQVLTTLLQVLDEGILRDVKNREVSFRDTIIIATSNAGADKIRAYIEHGYQLTQFKEQITNELINSGEFKPEFLNRFDEICVFKPLSESDLLQVVDLIIKSVNKTLEPQKISVILDEDAKRLLVARGNDPRLGARPMRRIVQKTVENLVAKAVLSGAAGNGSQIAITSQMIEEQLQ